MFVPYICLFYHSVSEHLHHASRSLTTPDGDEEDDLVLLRAIHGRVAVDGSVVPAHGHPRRCDVAARLASPWLLLILKTCTEHATDMSSMQSDF